MTTTNDILTPFLQIFGEQALSINYNLDGTIEYISPSWHKHFITIPPALFSPTELIKINKIREQVIYHTQPMSYVSLYPIEHLQTNKPLQTAQKHFMIYYTLYPTLNEHGQITNLFLIGEFFKYINLFDILRQSGEIKQIACLSQKQQTVLNPVANLSDRELEVLFLLLNGLSQRDIASFLNIARGTISKIISTRIAKKIGATSGLSDEIVDKALNMGLHLLIPESLLRSTVLELGIDGV